jgi:hypothetical protein
MEIDGVKRNPHTGRPKKDFPFDFERAGLANSFPVYPDYKKGRTQVWTVVRKYTGDVQVIFLVIIDSFDSGTETRADQTPGTKYSDRRESWISTHQRKTLKSNQRVDVRARILIWFINK